MEVNPPFEQWRACDTVKFSFHAHRDFIWSLPSRNYLLFRSKWYRFNDIAFNQLDAPFSLAKSSDRISFLFMLCSITFLCFVTKLFLFHTLYDLLCFSWASGRDRDQGLASWTHRSYSLKQSSGIRMFRPTSLIGNESIFLYFWW